jgi:hypothetical protein
LNTLLSEVVAPVPHLTAVAAVVAAYCLEPYPYLVLLHTQSLSVVVVLVLAQLARTT